MKTESRSFISCAVTIDFPLMADVAGNDGSVAVVAQGFALNPEHLERTESPRWRQGRVYKTTESGGPRFVGARGIGLVAAITKNRVCGNYATRNSGIDYYTK